MLTLVARVARKLGHIAERRADHYLIRQSLERLDLGHAHTIRTYTNISELHMLFRLAAACPPRANVVEIGSHLGASSCFIAAGLSGKGGRLFCVDTWQNETMPEGGQDTLAAFQQNTYAVRDLITVVRKRSSCLVESDLAHPLHLAFIDADHSYDSVRSDFDHIAPLMADDGIIAFHDTNGFQGVSRTLGETLASGSYVIVGHLRHLTWIQPAKWTK